MVKKSLLWAYRASLTLLWLTITILACSVLALRYIVLPHIDDYKDKIAQQTSTAIGQKVTIGNIYATWEGLNPHLSLYSVDLYDKENRPALTLGRIETSLSWLSIPLLKPHLASIAINKPELTIRRESNGTVYVAGIPMGGTGRPDFPNWLLRQSQIDIIDATVLWQDDLRKAPPLNLNKLNLQIVSPAWEILIGHHRFGLHATPSAGSSQPIDIRGNIYGKDVGKINKWHGTVYAKLEGTDIGAWRNWVDYPFNLSEGFGAAQFWLDFTDGQAKSIVSDVIFNNVKTRLYKNSPEVSLTQLSGRLQWLKHGDGQEVRAEHIQMATPDGLDMHNGYIAVREREQKLGKTQLEGSVKLDEFHLESINRFASYLPIPQETLQRMTDIAPVGILRHVEMQWKGDETTPQKYSIRGLFSGLGIQPYQGIPGFSNLSGSVDADESDGTITIDSQQALLNFEKVMRWPIPADKLTGQVKWANSKNKTEIHVNNLAVANTHLAGIINASYTHNLDKNDLLDLTAKLGNVDAKFAHYYYPKILGERTLSWLDNSIISGHGENVNVIIKGNPHEFPYRDNKNGLFRVTAKITDGVLETATGWPSIENIKLDMLFEGDRMELNANAGSILGNKIIRAKVSIPELDSHEPMLDIVGEAQGPVSEGIKYVNNSPIIKVTSGFTDGLRTTGNGKLNLELHIPLHDIDATKVKGAYVVSNGSMSSDIIPELTRLNGKLEFTESSLRAQNISTWAYGGPAQFTVTTGKDHVINITTQGHVTDAGLKQAFGEGPVDHISGGADWSGIINVVNKQADMNFNSNLVGIASSLPAPLTKSASEAMPLHFEKKQQSSTQDIIKVSLGNLIAANLGRTSQNGVVKIDRGEIGLNTAPELPTQAGIGIRGNLDYLDIDEWRKVLQKSSSKSIASNATNGAILNRIDLTINTLDVFDKRINGFKVNAKAMSDGWQMNLQSREITGDVQWYREGNGKVVAKLKNLIAPTATPDAIKIRPNTSSSELAQDYPELDIVADNFEIGKKKLGHLELQASEKDGNWSIEKLRIVNPDSVLTASGAWYNWKRNPSTLLSFNWAISDLGKALARFGYIDTIKAGEADLTGQLKWPGSPHEFYIPDLSGNLQLDAKKGQILKIQPGVGRLFSVLSLQNLPRRLSLDFRDVFSSGFTFDQISSTINISRGVMHSDNFVMKGPTAQVEMHGETDLQKETQHLFVKVTPYISDSLSLAAFAGGPVVGAAAFIAQKILKDPLNKLAESEYEITGTWSNPQEVSSASSNKTSTPTD